MNPQQPTDSRQADLSYWQVRIEKMKEAENSVATFSVGQLLDLLNQANNTAQERDIPAETYLNLMGLLIYKTAQTSGVIQLSSKQIEAMVNLVYQLPESDVTDNVVPLQPTAPDTQTTAHLADSA